MSLFAKMASCGAEYNKRGFHDGQVNLSSVPITNMATIKGT
jgi:hypothetical protein